MSFRALLVSKDNQAAEVLTPVLSDFGFAVECCGYSEAVGLVTEQKFQAVLVDYDDPQNAALIVQNISAAPFDNHPTTVALLADKEKVRSVFGSGANFVLYKPLTSEQAEATLRAASTLLKRERRNTYRVPIQVAVKLRLQSSNSPWELEGILLDLSETGMDVLASKPLFPSAQLHARFTLPSAPEFELQGAVAWANPNGETGVRFTDTPDSLRAALHCWLVENCKPVVLNDRESIAECTLTDLSLGGCYVETASPFPERTPTLLIMRADGAELRSEGMIKVVHPSRGMGIELAVRTARQRQHTEKFINLLNSRPGLKPELMISLQQLSADPEANGAQLEGFDDPLLDLLRNHESLSEEAFLSALKSQRSAEFAQV